MATWNALFNDLSNYSLVPEAELYKYVKLLEKGFKDEKNIRIWDLGCGAGRHTIALAKLGIATYASDSAPKSIEITNRWLKEIGAAASVELADMTECPWDDVRFHGVFSWDVLQHNTLDNIIMAVDKIHKHLLPSGILLATIKSDKADLYGKGREIEPKTFILDTGKEAGVPHHYFDETGIRNLFCKSKWEIMAMAEQVITNVERPEGFWEYTPFRSTTWNVLMKKKSVRE